MQMTAQKRWHWRCRGTTNASAGRGLGCGLCGAGAVVAVPQRADRRGRPPADKREVLNGVLWILRTGAQWRELPSIYPPYQTVHGRFQQWVRSGQLEKALRILTEKLREEGKLSLDEGFIDGSFAAAKKGPCSG